MWSSEIRRARLRIGWTLEELAREVGVSTRTLIRWEQEDSVPPPRALQEVANITGTELRLAFKPARALDPDRRCECGRILPPRRRRWCSDRCRDAHSR